MTAGVLDDVLNCDDLESTEETRPYIYCFSMRLGIWGLESGVVPTSERSCMGCNGTELTCVLSAYATSKPK